MNYNDICQMFEEFFYNVEEHFHIQHANNLFVFLDHLIEVYHVYQTI